MFGIHFYSVSDLILPLGISFFTFTQIAYLIDVSRGEVKETNFIHYLLFVSYFPHLIAGPLLHHSQIMPQFMSKRVFLLHYEHIAIGLTVFTVGLAKKVLIADTLALYATPVFNLAATGVSPSSIEAWTGSVAYTLQLYFDFSGYSDMAIGLSLLFNIRLPINFFSPYRATSIIDFWRRWHMTLSQFLRDYLYIPLGGGRRGTLRRYFNLIITMLLGGFWHGAGWTFIIWGLLHGFFLTINHIWRGMIKGTALEKIETNFFIQVLYAAITFICVLVGWVVFRSETLDAAVNILIAMIGFNKDISENVMVLTPLPILQAWTIISIGLIIVIFMPNSIQWMSNEKITIDRPPTSHKFPRLLVWRGGWFEALFVGLLLSFSLLSLTRTSEFLYFQF